VDLYFATRDVFISVGTDLTGTGIGTGKPVPTSRTILPSKLPSTLPSSHILCLLYLPTNVNSYGIQIK
jgi:hypothetical protein